MTTEPKDTRDEAPKSPDEALEVPESHEVLEAPQVPDADTQAEKTPQPEATKPKKRWPAFAAGVLMLALLGGLGALAVQSDIERRVNQTPLGDKLTTPARITVEKGDGALAIAKKLRDAGFEVTDFNMRLAAHHLKSDLLTRIHTGNYKFTPGLTLSGIFRTLEKGPLIDQSIRIPDGAPIWEVLAIFQNAPNLKQTTTGLTPAELCRTLGIDAQSPEGWFAPDTYHYVAGSTDVAVMKQAVAKQKAVLMDAWNVRSAVLRVSSPYEALTLASIIEKETSAAADRHLVSSVFHNRLKKKMLLQTDPTVIYGIGPDFNGNITKKDLKTPTAYNTYVIPALPPTPIGAPSAASIEAALNPSDADFLYFVARGDGTSQFSKTLAEHNRAVRKYILKKPAAKTDTKKDAPNPDAALQTKNSGAKP